MASGKGLILAVGVVLCAAGVADAQVAISIGNPWYGRGVYVGAPAYVAPPVVVPPVVAAPVYGPPVVGLGVGVYPRYPVYRPFPGPYYGPRPWGPYRRW
ncbi:MAG TPA: hypothetical protein VGH33_25550 [Isosphaeraceae bacterium]